MDISKLLLELDLASKQLLLDTLTKELRQNPEFGKFKEDLSSNHLTICPHCQSSKINGHGKFKERTRYLCTGCKKTFTGLTGTAVSGIHKTVEFQLYLDLMITGISIRKASKELKISPQTIFDWRHKILSSLSNINQKEFLGIVECDDKQLNISDKGNKKLVREAYKRPSDRQTKRGVSNDKVSIIVASDRSGNATMQVSKIGRIEAQSIEDAIGNMVSSENTLCSDSHPSILSWAKSRELEHHTFVANKAHIKDKCYHVQHVNSLDNRFERWIDKFYGVATKYLQNYLNWFVFIEQSKKSTQPIVDLTKEILMNINTITKYKAIQLNYTNLLKTTVI